MRLELYGCTHGTTVPFVACFGCSLAASTGALLGAVRYLARPYHQPLATVVLSSITIGRRWPAYDHG
jgi:hypothetical protein